MPILPEREGLVLGLSEEPSVDLEEGGGGKSCDKKCAVGSFSGLGVGTRVLTSRFGGLGVLARRTEEAKGG